MKSLIRVAIVEDHAGYRETLGQIFADTTDFKVAGSCANAEAALKQIPNTDCNLVLMDINLPGQSGIDCLRALKAQNPGLRVVMLTSYDDNENLFQSLMAGADGYLLKRVARSRLLEALRDIVAGGAPISPQIARRMVEYFHIPHTLGQADRAGDVPLGVILGRTHIDDDDLVAVHGALELHRSGGEFHLVGEIFQRFRRVREGHRCIHVFPLG